LHWLERNKMPKILDISPLISPRTAVWTGDTPFSQKFLCRFDEGAHLDLSTITTTVHIGAHTDAPSHYQADGKTMEARDLRYYYGACQVITVSVEQGSRVYPKDLPTEIQAPRVLLRTNSFPDPEVFTTDFCSLSPELVHHAHEQGVQLIGLDTPSVDPYTSKGLEAHNAVADCDMAILEGVVLDDVEDGIYTLVAFPLKIEGADASPVRAILITE
jgi:arylformamidase